MLREQPGIQCGWSRGEGEEEGGDGGLEVLADGAGASGRDAGLGFYFYSPPHPTPVLKGRQAVGAGRLWQLSRQGLRWWGEEARFWVCF